MGRIKSALEIALERTESVKVDKASISLFDAKQKGKKLANEFLGEGGKSAKDLSATNLSAKSLEDEIKKYPKDERESFKQGIFDVLVSQIILPDKEEDLGRVETAVKGIQIIVNDNKFNGLVKQFSQILRQYLNEAAQYEEAIKRQYAPKLRQKEEELSRRTGRQIALDPFQDPEFVAFFNQNMNALKENYQAIINQVREEASRFLGK